MFKKSCFVILSGVLLASCSAILPQPPYSGSFVRGGEPIVYFDYNSTTITKDGEQTLAWVANKLEHWNRKNVQVVGHTDVVGTEKYNNSLSKRRAEAVKKYLVQLGVDEQRIVIEYKGKSDPVVLEPERQEINRRVVVTIK